MPSKKSDMRNEQSPATIGSPETTGASENGSSSSAAERVTRKFDEIKREMDEIIEIWRRDEDVEEIAFKAQVLVQEEVCVRCSRPQGEPHKLGSCIAVARVEEIRERFNRK